MQNNKKNIVVVKFEKAQQPKFKEDKAKGYVKFGENNDYSSYLLDLYEESPKHGAIVDGKADYVYGKGFETLKTNQANSAGETWNAIVKKAIKDDELHSGYYLQIIWDRAGLIADVFHIPFQKVRSNKANTVFYVKDDWKCFREQARKYECFNLADKTKPQILFVKQYSPKNTTYPIPGYFQALNYIESDIQISRHILGNAKSGFVAGTMINFNNGAAIKEEEKEEIETGIKEKFTGSDGDRVIITFNASQDKAATVVPLGNTMLTKEDFTNINNLVQQEIFAGHRITSPSLFGIKTEGQLGGNNEIRTAYEIFKNTYVNARQQEHEETFNKLFALAGIQGEHKISPVEPLGFQFTENVMKENMSRDEIREKMGYKPDGLAPTPSNAPVVINNQLSNITGRQQQGLMRIARLFAKGTLTKEQATIQLKAFGFTDEEINSYLGIDDDPNTEDQQFAQQMDDNLFMEFVANGEAAEGFEIIHSEPAKGSLYFKTEVDVSKIEANVMDLISRDKRMTPEVLASTLQTDVKVINRILDNLQEAGYISISISTIGPDEVTERTLTRPLSEITDQQPTVTEVLVRYSYDWKPEIPVSERNTADHPSRPFCVKLMQLNKLYSRQDIETISTRVGYSVWDRKGGWWTMPNGVHSPECRHLFKVNIVTRRK